MKHTWIYFLLGGLMTFYACNSNDEPELPKEKPEPRLSKVDSLALVKIYQAADGDNWLAPWKDLNDPYTWKGGATALDTVANEYRVVAFWLYAGEAHGVISPYIGDLTELVELQITGKNLTGEIPKEIGNLKNLRSLEILQTSMTGGIPKEVVLLPNLEYLEIGSNPNITGELPEELSQVNKPNAKYRFWYNSLTGKVPSGIVLEFLNLMGNKYTEYPFEYCFEGKTNVGMEENYISGTIPDSVLADSYALKKLQILTINQKDGNRFSNAPEWFYHY